MELSVNYYTTLYRMHNKFHNAKSSNLVANCDFAAKNAIIPDSKYLFIAGIIEPSINEDVYYINLARVPDNTIYLCLSSKHESKIERFPSNLQYLRMVYPYNYEYDNLPEGLTHLITNIECNIKNVFSNLPSSLQFLIITSYYNHFCANIDYLPPSLEYLSLSGVDSYYSNMDYLPVGLKYLGVPPYYKKKLHNLPPMLEILDIYSGYDGEIAELPNSIKKILVSSQKDYKIPNEYKHLVETL